MTILPQDEAKGNTARSQAQQLPLFVPGPTQPRPRESKRGSERRTSPVSLGAFEQIKRRRAKLYLPILQMVTLHGPRPEDCLTAREILRALIARGDLPPGSERNAVSPRNCELLQAGCLENPIDQETAKPYLKRVAGDAPASTWRITIRGRALLEHLIREAAI